MGPLKVYRDDGPIADAIQQLVGQRPVPTTIALIAGIIALIAGIAVDVAAGTGVPGPATVAGLFVHIVLASAGGEPKGRLRWLTSPILRLGEYGLVAVLVAADAQARPFAYALLAVVAFHLYDTVYRLRHARTAVPRWVRWLGLGWEGRMIVVAVLAALGALAPGALVLSLAFFVLFTAESIASWVRLAPAGVDPDVGEDDDEEL